MTQPDRVRCAVCGRYPTLTKTGAIHNHAYPWPHSQEGQPCPGSGTQITPLEGQTSLEDLCDEPSSASS